jgi:immunity protein, SdpI family
MTRWGHLSLALVLAAFVGAAYVQLNADEIPGDRIPIHWNIHGEVDGWASKDQPFLAFYLMPVVIGGIVVLGLFVLPWLSPRNFAVEGFRATYDYVFFLVTALFAYLEGVILWSQFEGGAFPERWLIAGFFLFFALIGNVLGKVKSNFWMGIRTPWTLASERVWNQTHRVAAWLYVAVGLLGFVGVLAGVPPVVCFVFLIVGALAPALYSLVLYKRLEREGKLEVQQQSLVGQE